MKQLPILSAIAARPRLLVAIFFGIIQFLCLPENWGTLTRLLVAWDLGTALYLLMVVIMMVRADETGIRRRAKTQDDGGLVILGITVGSAVASLAAIMHELATAKTLTGHAQWQAIALAAATVLLSWGFMQTMFALHYAHEFYNADGDDNTEGLEFPGGDISPDYWDFVYFSFIIGTAAQTADVNITSKVIRRIVTLHCVIVFFFNTTILALAINVGAGLL